MERFFLKAIFISAMMVSAAAGVQAQAQAQSGGDNLSDTFAAPPKRPQLLKELGLSQEQKQQIRLINQERKAAIENVQQRLRSANLALDEAVYADNPSENAVRERMREVQSAQSTLIETRTKYELKVRDLLTSDQLVRFRRLRLQFMPRLQPRSSPKLPKAERQMRRKLRNQSRKF